MGLNFILGTVAIAGIIALITFLVLDRRLHWRLSLIVTVLAICAYGLGFRQDAETGQWHNNLKLGLDLAGGTSLLYEVSVDPDTPNQRDVIKQMIEVLQRRVDPAGDRSLVWREEAGNRIEIQMPRASVEVDQKRQAMEAIDKRVTERNITLKQIETALERDGDAFERDIADLEKEVAGRVDLLRTLKEKKRARDTARAAYNALADEQEQEAMAPQVATAEREYDLALQDVLATNLSMSHLRRALSLSDTALEGQEISPRERAMADIRSGHPLRGEDIEAFNAAYLAYMEVKGPLDDPSDLIRLLRGAGVLEFRITVNSAEAPDIDSLREQLAQGGPATQAGRDRVWVRIDDISMFAETVEERVALQSDPGGYLASTRGLMAGAYGEDIYVLTWNTTDKSLLKRPEQEGWALQQAFRDRDERQFNAVSFVMNPRGGRLLSELTGPNVGRNMAMVLDGALISAPTIQSRLSNRVIITGGTTGFSHAEQSYLVRTLAAGSLQAQLSQDPIAIRTVGPNLGADNLSQGLEAARDALIVVALFMMAYYFFAGSIAGLALVANVVIILGVMSLRETAFTLPGIAGIVLTIGMCVDANVLIFERIREELNRGADALTAVRLGYEKAFSSIIDSNITNLIVCVILYQTATVEVRGFAVTLGVGICATLFTSLFMTRAIFDLMYRIRPKWSWTLAQLPTWQPAVDRLVTPNIRWISKKPIFFTISAVAIVASVIMVAQRGDELLDIEFRAGTEVAFELAEGNVLPLDEVRSRVSALGRDSNNPAISDLNSATVVSIGNDLTGNREFAAFSVVSTAQDSTAVSDAIKAEFMEVLDAQARLTFADAQIESVDQAPVYPITRSDLASVINRATNEDVGAWRGGVAIVLRDIKPATASADALPGVSLDELRSRIRSMRLKPDFEQMPFRDFEVIGLTAVPSDITRYSDIAVVVRDDTANYFSNAAVWNQMAQGEWRLVREALDSDTSLSKVSNFTPTVAETMKDRAIVALLLSFIAIVAYIWFRFGSLRYGLAAIAALAHDVIIALGCVAATHFIYQATIGEALLVSEFKLNLGLIAALLTIVGYSLNDTIVLFDRIRENRGKLAHVTPAIIDLSINQCISRTLLTSFTTLLAVGMLYIFGGEGIRGFAFALIIGVCVGTYSSIAIASPMLTVLVGKGTTPPAKPQRPDQANQPPVSANG